MKNCPAATNESDKPFVTSIRQTSSRMFRRLPPIIQFIYVCMIGICIGTIAGLVNEFLLQPFSATNAVVWLFLFLVSSGVVTLITLYGRNRIG